MCDRTIGWADDDDKLILLGSAAHPDFEDRHVRSASGRIFSARGMCFGMHAVLLTAVQRTKDVFTLDNSLVDACSRDPVLSCFVAANLRRAGLVMNAFDKETCGTLRGMLRSKRRGHQKRERQGAGGEESVEWNIAFALGKILLGSCFDVNGFPPTIIHIAYRLIEVNFN
jgi:hypothetical protein